MFRSETQVRVRYAETDKMGYCYYGNYATYYEVGRVEAMRMLGMTYREVEDRGVGMPVLTFSIKYFKPAFYDDLLTVVTIIREMPSTRILFEYEIYNEKKEMLNKGETTLVFVDYATGKPRQAPDWFLEKLKPFIEKA